MSSKIKNIIIIGVVAIALILGYFFFIKKAPDQAPLVSSSGASAVVDINGSQTEQIGNDFISVLLNVKNIKLDDSIFLDPAFISLKDSSILLSPTGDEGRPNPFAPIGVEATAAPLNSSQNVDTTNNTIANIPASTDIKNGSNTN